MAVGVGELRGVACLHSGLRYRGGEDDARGLLFTSTPLASCGEVYRGYLATLLVGEFECYCPLVLGELGIHPRNRRTLYLVELGRYGSVGDGVRAVGIECLVDGDLIYREGDIARLVGRGLAPVERHALHRAALGLDVHDALRGGGDGLTVDRHPLYGSFGDREVDITMRIGRDVRASDGNTLHGGLRHTYRLIRAIACEEVVCACIGFDERHLALILIGISVTQMYLQVGYLRPICTRIYVDESVLLSIRVSFVIDGYEVTSMQGLPVVPLRVFVCPHCCYRGIDLTYAQGRAVTLKHLRVVCQIYEQLPDLPRGDRARLILAGEGFCSPSYLL